MKESDITDEVIRLSKEIAKYWRMNPDKGSFVRIVTDEGEDRTHLVECAAYDKKEINDCFWLENGTDIEINDRWVIWFPIPSISDCLEKLRELVSGTHVVFVEYPKEGDCSVTFYCPDADMDEYIYLAKTPHEALLSALLEVLKEREK